MTRGNELGQQTQEMFDSQNPPRCIEDSRPVTVYIQIKDSRGRPKFLTITQLCPESDQLAYLRRIMEGNLPRGAAQFGFWRTTEPYSNPNEYNSGTFRTRTLRQARLEFDVRMDQIQEDIDRQNRRLDLAEALTDCYSRTVGAGPFEGAQFNCESLADGRLGTIEAEASQ